MRCPNHAAGRRGQSLVLSVSAQKKAWRRNHRLPQRGHTLECALSTQPLSGTCAPVPTPSHGRHFRGLSLTQSHYRCSPPRLRLSPVPPLAPYRFHLPCQSALNLSPLRRFRSGSRNDYIHPPVEHHALRFRSHHIRSKDQGRCPSTTCRASSVPRYPVPRPTKYPRALLTRSPHPGRIHHRSRQQDVPLRMFPLFIFAPCKNVFLVLVFTDFPKFRAADWYHSAKWFLICISLTFKRLFGPK